MHGRRGRRKGSETEEPKALTAVDGAAEAARKRRQEAQKLAAQWGLTEIADEQRTDAAEEWHVTLRSDRAELILVFVLPQDYPPAPPRASAVLASRSGLETTPAESAQEGSSDELYSATVTSMLREQVATKRLRVSALIPIARQWLDAYTERVICIEQQQREEAERRALEALAEAEALEEARRVAADGLTSFTRWLKRVGIKAPKSIRHGMADIEEVFARKLPLRKARAHTPSLEPLHALCVKVLAESLLRYESLAGYPLQMRQKIFAYLVNDLHLLFPEHLSVLLDDEFRSLDFTGMASPGKTNKTRDEHVKQVGRLCPRLREINLSNAVRITSFSLSEGIASCMQLARLVIDGCAQVGDMGVAVVADGCPKLVEFSARRCLGITHNALYVLGRRCLQLEIVRIAGCTNIHIEGLLDLARFATQLQVLDATEVGNNVIANNRDFPRVPPNRLANQRLETLMLDGCNYVTRAFVQDLLGPLEGQVCPRLQVVSLMRCPRISNGTLEQVVLPRCPGLKAYRYSRVPGVLEHSKRTYVTEIDVNYLSFLPGCRYVFPIRSAKLPVFLAQIRAQMLRGSEESQSDDQAKVFTQAEIDKVVSDRAPFLASIDRFEANAQARRALRGIETLTLASVTWNSPFTLIEAVISMPSLRCLDITHSNVSLRDTLLSCYYFLPQLHTLVFAQLEAVRESVREAGSTLLPTKPYWHRHIINYHTEVHEKRERAIQDRMAQQYRQLRAVKVDGGTTTTLSSDAAEQAESDAELKRRQWVVDHIGGRDKRHSMSLNALDVSGHEFEDGAAFLDLIADRCPELRRLNLARTEGIGAPTLLALLEKCVHLVDLDLRGLDLSPETLVDLRNKRPALVLHTDHASATDSCSDWQPWFMF